MFGAYEGDPKASAFKAKKADRSIMWGLIIGGFFIGCGHASWPVAQFLREFWPVLSEWTR